ncbi:MAG: hypothetical protein ACNYPH_00670 [Gammaproteobacteria bacterium WSBS_2016_MAG_OTU1]
MTTLPANFALPSADGYAAYIRAVEAIPPITESEEKTCSLLTEITTTWLRLAV